MYMQLSKKLITQKPTSENHSMRKVLNQTTKSKVFIRMDMGINNAGLKKHRTENNS